jgi:ubiquinone/menaquinone biosynthesis C-methylase UbiE
MDDKTLAAQLRCPSGEEGLEVGKAMNEHNRDMNELAIQTLNPQKGDRILEIGPGNGAFVQEIFKSQDDIHYSALDISGEMIKVAEQFNATFIKAGKANWHLGSSDKMPFEENYFDKIMTVNTLYFMDPVEKHLAEMYQVLKPGGKLILCFGNRRYMEKMPFTAHGFNLYTKDSAQAFVTAAGFEIVDVSTHKSVVSGLTEEPINKETICMVAEKPKL